MSFAGSVAGTNPNPKCEKKGIQPQLVVEKVWQTVQTTNSPCEFNWEGTNLKINFPEHQQCCDNACTLSIIKNNEFSYDLLIDSDEKELPKVLRVDLKNYVKNGVVFNVLLLGQNAIAYSLGKILS